MKNDILEYKGYFTRIEYSAEDSVLFGKIEGINDLVNFESESAKKIEEEFHSAVDDYLSYCAEIGVEPDKSYKGSFNVRINPELHKKLSLAAFEEGISINEIVKKSLEKYLYKREIHFNFNIFNTDDQRFDLKGLSKQLDPNLLSNTNSYILSSMPVMASYLQ